jgi:putative lipoprotein
VYQSVFYFIFFGGLSMKLWQLLSGAVLAVALVGCNTMNQPSNNNEGAEALAVTGSVFYRDRSALPEHAMVTVTLADASKQDVAVTVLSQVSFPAAGKQVPFNFALPYTASQISNHARIIVSARIDVDGKLMYTTTRMHEVLSNGQTTANIQLDRVESMPQ